VFDEGARAHIAQGGMTMGVARGRIRLGATAAAVAALLLVFLPVTAAQAATPVHFSFTMPVVFTDTATCGFPINVNLLATVHGTAFLDAQGNPQRVIIEQGVVGTDSANGSTLRDATHYVDHINSLGADKQTGLTFHVQGKGEGVVLRDAGYIMFNPDGSIAFTHGPHPFLDGDTAAFCAALS
jgi:hypothetical protein